MLSHKQELIDIHQQPTDKFFTVGTKFKVKVKAPYEFRTQIQTFPSNLNVKTHLYIIKMAKISSAAVTILLCLLQFSPFTNASTSIINANGVLTHSSISDSSISIGSTQGIVGIISSPGTSSPFDTSSDGEGGVNLSSLGGVSILSSPGATLSGTTSLAKGNGAAAVASVAGSIILSGITLSDAENGLYESRHGQTLTAIFRAKMDTLMSDSNEEGEEEGKEVKPTKLFLVFPTCDVNEDDVKQDVQSIFDAVLAEKGVVIDLETVFDLNVVQVDNEEDAKKVCFYSIVDFFILFFMNPEQLTH